MTTLSPRRLVFWLGFLLIALVGASLLGLMFGSSSIDLWLALSEWVRGDVQSVDATILVEARLPRVVLAGVVGAGLACVGAVFQGLLRNPLADPYILGVSGGASVGAIVVMSLGITGTVAGMSVLPAAAFVGAMASVAIIYGVASALPGGLRGLHTTYTIPLTGVVFNAFTMAIVLFLRTVMSPLDAQRALFWLMGSLTAGRLNDAEVWTVIICVAVGVTVLVWNARKLNLLVLGDDTALSLGVHPARARLGLFIVSSVVVGAAVSAAGMVGFVGLVVPHALRLLLGADHRLLIPASALGGAAFMVLADLVSRVMFPLVESTLPVGAVTAFIGVPAFFLFLIRDLRQQTRRG